jgi:hypothetical protein
LNPTLASILQEIERIRTFTGESYLTTTRFVVFLVFGGSEEQLGVLSAKANRLIAERQAFAIVEAADDAAEGIAQAIGRASLAHINIKDLNEIHICPVIFSEESDPSAYPGVLSAVEARMGVMSVQTVWKPFLLLDTSRENAGEWLAAVSEGILSLGEMHSCRCCVLTRVDSDGYAVAEEFMLTTVLFVTFMHVVRQTRESLGRHIGFRHEREDCLFYTAQTAFVENPMVTRLLRRMSGLLKSVSESRKAKDIDMGFLSGILEEGFAKMPRENGSVSLLPIYGVMPGEDFKGRLQDFANTHYLAFLLGEAEKKDAYAKISMGYLRAHLRAGLSYEELGAQRGNPEGVKNLIARSRSSVRIGDLPEYPGNQGQEVALTFDRFARALRGKLQSLNGDLLEGYFDSEEYLTLPARCHDAHVKLNDEIAAMDEMIQKRSNLDVTLPLLNDPDEKWLEEAGGDAAVLEGFYGHFCAMALAENEEIRAGELSELLREVYRRSKGLSGDARLYMKLVSETCGEIDSDSAKLCVQSIGEKLVFPVRVGENFKEAPSFTYVWGSSENKLWSAWEKYQTLINVESEPLALKSDERFAILRVSAPFRRGEVLRVGGGDRA